VIINVVSIISINLIISDTLENIFIAIYLCVIIGAVGNRLFEFLRSPDKKLLLMCGVKGTAFVKLAVKIINADGKIESVELKKLNTYMRHKYGDRIIKPLNKFIEGNKIISESAGAICEHFVEATEKERIDVFYRLFSIAATDKLICEAEELILKDVAREFEISSKRYNTIKKSLIKEPYNYSQDHDERAQQNQAYNSYILEHLLRKVYNPYEVLGIDQNASIEEVKSVYRNLAKLYHPDKSMNESMDKKRQNALKILEINQAYEEIKKIRGIK
jgi:DnaJ-domain-containing protein 1